MNRKKIYSALLAASLILSSFSVVSAKTLINEGYKLDIPSNMENELLTELLSSRGQLFSVKEKESFLSAKRSGADYDGAGWLFSIGKINGGELRRMLCGDMSGREVFAKDARGSYFVYYHPTDVRYMRDNDALMRRDAQVWTKLNEWAWQNVRDKFIKDNPGLTPISFDNSNLGIHLAQIAFKPGVEYTISTNRYGSLNPGYVPGMPYALKLLTNAKYTFLQNTEAPDGEYVALNFPDEKARYDFFLDKNKVNYVREVRDGLDDALYRAEFADKSINAASVMQEWCNALAGDREMRQLGFKPESFLGKWAEKIAGRGQITITKADKRPPMPPKNDGEFGRRDKRGGHLPMRGEVYKVEIRWPSSASEVSYWTMTAWPVGSNVLRYANCHHSVLTFDQNSDERRELIYKDGTGTLTLNSANEIMWSDDKEPSADNALFISAN